MGHPMHLHGHKFWVLGSGSGQFPYTSVDIAPSSVINLENPPYRDTTDLPASGWLAIRLVTCRRQDFCSGADSNTRYITDNPGAWLFHCHLQWHAVVGITFLCISSCPMFLNLIHRFANSAISFFRAAWQ